MPQACGFLELIQKRELSFHTVIDLSVVSLSITFLVVVLRCFIVAPGSKRQARRAHLLLPSDRTYFPARYYFVSPQDTPLLALSPQAKGKKEKPRTGARMAKADAEATQAPEEESKNEEPRKMSRAPESEAVRPHPRPPRPCLRGA